MPWILKACQFSIGLISELSRPLLTLTRPVLHHMGLVNDDTVKSHLEKIAAILDNLLLPSFIAEQSDVLLPDIGGGLRELGGCGESERVPC